MKTTSNQTQGLFQRFARPTPDRIQHELILDRGSMSDYAALSQHHYLAGRPATVTRVWVLRHRNRSVVDRFLNRGMDRRIVGMLVESVPRINCRARDWALGDRFANLPIPQRAVALYEQIRCISRVVVDPQWRGLGLAIRLVRHALDNAQTPYTEAIAAMGNVHPFFQRAGMTPYTLPTARHDARARDALARVGIGQVELAEPQTAMRIIERLAGADRYWIGVELRRWYRTSMARSASPGTDLREHLGAAQQRLGFHPVYYLHHNNQAPQKGAVRHG